MWEIGKRAAYVLIYGSLIYAMVNHCALFLKREGPQEAIRTSGVWHWLCCLSMGGLSACRYEGFCLSGTVFCLGMGALLFAAVMDRKCCQVYRFVWWICGGAGMALFWLQSGLQAEREMLLYRLVQWVEFCLLQKFYFSKKYGMADCHAFCCCSLFLCAGGGGLWEYLIHMLLSFGILGMIQFLRHNINSKGNLKEPVPFIPYIGLAFILLWGWKELISPMLKAATGA